MNAWEKCARSFLLSVFVILTLTAIAKVMSGFGDAPALLLPDPVWMWPNRTTFLIGALLDVVFLGFLRLRTPLLAKLVGVVWLCLIFTAFRFSRWLIDAGDPCPCMGNLYAMIKLEPATVDFIMKWILAFMLSGSVLLLVAKFRIHLEKKRIGAADQGAVPGQVEAHTSLL